MIGLDAPGPGSGAFHFKLAFGDQVDGNLEFDTPDPDGPRKRVQSSAAAAAQKQETRKTIAIERYIGIFQLSSNALFLADEC